MMDESSNDGVNEESFRVEDGWSNEVYAWGTDGTGSAWNTN
jgi:hypothetical protein